VVEKSAAEKAGILAEDIITNFGGNSINSIDDLSKALADTKDKKDIVVEVMRAGKAKTLYVQIEKPLRKKEF
jgi:S1-C subfamily serine protease